MASIHQDKSKVIIRKTIFFFLITLVLSLIIPGYADNNSYTMAEYVPAKEKNSPVKADFYGIWKPKYVYISGYMLNAEPFFPNMSIEVFDNFTAVVNGERTRHGYGVLIKKYLLVSLGNNVQWELILLDDGMVSFHNKEISISNGKVTETEYTVYFAKEAVSYESIPYSFLSKTPNSYIGKYAYYSGTIIDALYSEEFTFIELAVNNNTNQVIVIFALDKHEPKFQKGDKANVYVRLAGLFHDSSKNKDCLRAYAHVVERVK